MEVRDENRIGSEVHAGVSSSGGVPSVARSLEMSPKTLANWVVRARKGEPLAKALAGVASTELEAEVTRLRQENAKLRLEKEILKKAAAYFAKESM